MARDRAAVVGSRAHRAAAEHSQETTRVIAESCARRRQGRHVRSGATPRPIAWLGNAR